MTCALLYTHKSTAAVKATLDFINALKRFQACVYIAEPSSKNVATLSYTQLGGGFYSNPI